MRVRALRSAAASLVVAGLFACSGGTSQPPSLSITPGGSVIVAGATLFTAVRVNSSDDVSWTLAGPGALSGTTGTEVVYSPPPLGATGTATLSAAAGALTASVSLTIGPPQSASVSLTGLSAAVQVSYDAEDVPHLTCAAVNDCLEVQGYLQARDRLFQMDLFRRTARGQLASLIGPLEISSDQEFLTFFTTRDGKKIEDQLVAALDPDTASKIGAFVNGINAYIAELQRNPSEPLPGEYAQLPYAITAADIPLWTAQDTLAIGRLQQFQLSETIDEETDYGMFAAAYAEGPLADPGKLNTWIRAQETEKSYTLPLVSSSRTPEARGAVPQPGHTSAAVLASYASTLAMVRARVGEAKALLGDLGIDTGSNNWVVDAAHSATGQAMVANDPHLSLQYPPLFHLIAMTATDSSGLDMQGGSFPGIPGALIGRGKHVGWGDTVVGYDVTDLYLEQVSPCAASPGGCAAFTGAGGTSIPLIPVPMTINVRGPAGLTPQTFIVLVNPVHGPFLAFNGSTGAGVSMRWTGHEVTADLRAFIGLNLASSVGSVADVGTASTSAFAALHYMGTGAQNFVLADDAGNIGYDPHALVPKRPWAGSVHNGAPLFPWLPLPGDGSAEWGSGNVGDACAGTPTAGVLPSANCWYADADLPNASSSATGYLVTANSDPAGYGDKNVPISVKNGAAFYLSFDWDDPTGFRHARISALLAAKTANSGKVAVSDMQAIQTDHASSLAGAFIPTLTAVAGGIGSAAPPAFSAAMAMLTQWNTDGLDCPTGLTGSSTSSAPVTDATVARDSAACLLFHVFVRTLLNNVFDDDLAIPGVGLDFGDAIRGMLYMLEPSTPLSDQTFCNDVDSSGAVVAPTSCPTQLVIALTTAYETLAGLKGATSNWVWGRQHTLTTVSPASPLVDGTFGAGPYARPGGILTVDVGNPSLSSADPLAFPYGSGSNLRFVAEMNPTTANTKMQLPGAERDGPQGVFSSSPNLIGDYVTNTYFDFAYSGQIAASFVSKQTFNSAGVTSAAEQGSR